VITVQPYFGLKIVIGYRTNSCGMNNEILIGFSGLIRQRYSRIREDAVSISTFISLRADKSTNLLNAANFPSFLS
jgi:hypothetical protein